MVFCVWCATDGPILYCPQHKTQVDSSAQMKHPDSLSLSSCPCWTKAKGCELLLLVNEGLQLARPWVAGISRVSECEHEHSSTVVRQGRRWMETNTKRKLVVIQVKPCFIVWLAEVTSQSSWRITIWCTILRNIFYPALLLISPPLLLPPPAPIPYPLFVLAIFSSLCTSLASWRLMNFLSLWIQWLLW